ncbi:MAG: glutathione S-transferase, partial [Rhodobacteraceae bacterium]|nr:glutathione S-transferase [Paracoccaceae bacterium]
MSATDAPLRLWHAAQSRSFRVLWFLHEAGLPHEVERVAFLGRALRDPAHLARSPAGRVPAPEVDGRVMFESG